MKTITKKYEVYTYDELSKEAQEKVLEDNRVINVDGEWYESDFEVLIEMLTKKGFDNAEIFFTGFCSQGDGACFTANINVDKVMTYFHLKTEYAELLKCTNINGCIRTNGSNYSHSNTMIIELEYDETKKISVKQEQKMYALQETLHDAILEIAKDEANKIYKELNNSYDYLTSNDVIIDRLRSNEIIFLKDGSPFNE